jgi:hypothetical protein
MIAVLKRRASRRRGHRRRHYGGDRRAYPLAKGGQSVILVEKDHVAMGETRHTTTHNH